MTHLLKKSPLACAIGACLLMSVAPAMAADGDVEQRIQSLEQEIQSLKSQVSQGGSSAGAPVKAAKSSSLTFGGYLKADYRNVSGDLAYQDYWRGNNPGEKDTNHTGFNVKETRLNSTYTNGDVKAFVEMDFYGGDGNEVATNSTNPRLRHAFIQYKNWMVGQYWSTFTPAMTFPDALDFGGPIVAEVFVRQPQIRYTIGGFSIALENPETWGDGQVDGNSAGGGASGVDADEAFPDVVATYKFGGDWGSIQVGALVRQIDSDTNAGGAADDELSETTVAANIGGLIKIGSKDDLRFQVNVGESGRYVGAGMVGDIVVDPDTGDLEVEETVAANVSYRHFWNADWRSTVYYGIAQTDVTELERAHAGVNLIRQLTPDLSVGVEVGNFAVNDDNGTDADSNYFQMSWKYNL
ncbi:DcaP family trimeric outer membrane transporter [Pseudomaricurvus sp. HS19]|uniref:DcaP family trimeric outer membrane transporter n=1 Tax=Pseudomaricurvus sp. HS19 TaxID=2692626 RepID=UPI0019295826|nr:DcaP family trimeric outer membrane transporter [Pseudomaricurvus sp. HS19]